MVFKFSSGSDLRDDQWEHTQTHTLTAQQSKEAYRVLLLKWSKLPGVKERLLLKKDREQRGREKEGEALRIEEFSEEKAESDSETVGSQSEVSAEECVFLYSTTAVASGNVHVLCGQVWALLLGDGCRIRRCRFGSVSLMLL